MEVGMNFDGGNKSLMFIDMMKFGRGFKAQEGANGMAEHYTVNMLTNLVTGAYSDVRFYHYALMQKQGKTNADGYPVSIPVTIRDHEDTRDIVITEMERWYDLPDNYPTGDASQPWILKWKGTGEVGLRYITAIHEADVVSSNLSGQWARGTSDGEGRLGVSISSTGAVKRLKIYSSDPADPIRDVRLIYPGLEAEFDAGEIFHPRFLEVMEPFNTIRFMDYFKANTAGKGWVHPESIWNEEWMEEQEWSDRITPNYYMQRTSYGGAHEYAIELCNQTMSDAWINIPFCASMDYVRNMAQLYKDLLNPDLTIYIELGNEIWNFGQGFNGYFWLSRTKERDYPGLGDGQARGARIADVMSTWTEVWGPKDMERCIRVVGMQTGYTDLNNKTLTYVTPENFDAIAITWYFGLNDQDKDDLETYYNSGVTQDQFSQEFANKVITKWRKKTGYSDFDMAKTHGNKMVITYEGGTHAISGNEYSGGFLQAQIAANQTPYYYDVYEEVMDSIQNWGITLAMHYKFVGGGSGWGYWGAQENIFMDPYANGQYKMQALLDRIATNNCEEVFKANLNETGPGNAIRFDGRNDHINVDEISFKPDDNSNYTYEAWFKPVTLNENQVITSFSNTTGNENYNLIQIRADNKLNWKIGNGGSLYVNLVGNKLVEAGKWQHAAVVKNGNRYTLFLNGQDVASVNYSATTMTRSAFTIGGYRNASGFSSPFNGEIDEIKLWNAALTAAEIREYMCKKTSAAHPKWSNLQVYFRLDNPDYDTHRAFDQKTSSDIGFLTNITYTERSGYLLSGAPIGDDSKTLYPVSWPGASLNYQHADGDIMAVSNLGSGNPAGVHIYVVNNPPYLNEPPILKGTTTMYEGNSDEKYYGVFVANGNDPNYDLTYMYAGHPDAYSGNNESKHRLIKRTHSADLDWIHSGAQLDQISNTLTLNCREKGRSEYHLAFRNNLNAESPGSGMALHFNNAYQRAVVKNTRVDDFTITAWIKGKGGVYNLTGFSNRGEEIFSVDDNLGYRLSTPDMAVQGFPGNAKFKEADSDEWYHLAVTRQGTRVTAYVNGILQTEKDFLGTNKVEEFYFGFKRNPELLKHPDIVLDELVVFDVALDEQTIREWMCKKITGEHPYACENLRLYFNLDQGQGTIIEDTRGPNDMELVNINDGGGPLPQWVVSGAPLGDESVYAYANPDNLSMSHPDGDQLEVSFNGDHVNAVHLYRTDNMVPNSTNTDNAGIQSIDESRYWGMYVYKPWDKNASYDVIYHYENNSAIAVENEIRLMERTENSTNTWQSNFGITPNTTAKTITLSDKYREEFILGGTTASTFAAGVQPNTPVFLTETPTINISTVCSNGAALVYQVEPDPFAVSYVWTLPPGLEGFSTADSIVITASGATGNVSISVAAVNAHGESAPATYDVEIIPAPTLADAGPDQMVLPPATSTTLDGNVVSGGETGTWTAIPDTVGIVIADINDEKSGVSNLVSGYNKFAWTIDNGVCPPITDTTAVLMAPPVTDIFVDVTGDLPSEFCSGTVITVTALPWENVTPDDYAWYPPDGMTVLSQSGAQATIQISDGLGGRIEVAAIYNGSESELYATHLINIRQAPVQPVFVDYTDTLCQGSFTDFTVALDASTTHYEWTIPEGIYPNAFPKSTTHEITLEAMDISEGWIKIRGFNGICTNENAVDSMYAVVMAAPPMPRVGDGGIHGNSGSWQAACHGSNAILWVRDDGADNYNWWVTDERVDIVEIAGNNNQMAVFDFNGMSSQFDVYVTATFGTGKCNTSPPNHWRLWPRSEPWYDAGNISVTNPPMQDPMGLNVGSQYDLQVSQGAADTYFWLLPDGTSFYTGDNREQDININVDYDFTDTVKVYAVTRAACTGEPARLLLSTGVFAPPPQLVSGNTEFCQGTNLNVTVTNLSSFGVTEYRWTMPDGTVYTTPTNTIDQQINDLLIGTVTVEALNAGGYSQPGSFDIRVLGNPIPEITFVDKNNNAIDIFEVCEGERKYARIRDVGASEYIWNIEGEHNFIMWKPDDPDNGYRTDPKTTGQDTIILIENRLWQINSPPEPNEGWLHVEARNPACGQIRRDSIFYELTIPVDQRIPVFIEEPTDICAGSSVTYRVENLDAADQYIWSLPAGLTAPSITTTISEITVDVAQGAGGTISVYVTSSACGGSTSPTVESQPITIHGAPLDFEFLEAPLAACPGDDITFTVNDVGSSEYTWSIPDGLSPNIPGKNIVIDEDDPLVTMSGTWTTNTDSRSIEEDILQTGEKNINTWMRFTPDLPYTGTYNVYMSYPWGVNTQYNNRVPVEVNHMGYIEEFRMNQAVEPTYDGTYWYLGTWDFEKGTSSGYVEILTEDAYQYRTIRADAVKFELVSKFAVPDTSITFEALGGDIGAVCVTAENEMCASGYTICTNPVNTGEDMGSPSFNSAPEDVCVGTDYTFEVADIGADTYTWMLPAGMNISGATGIVTDQPRNVIINMASDPGSAVQIGVFGVINSCGVKSDTVYSADINFGLCQLEDPVFMQEADTLCLNETASFIVSAVTNAENYEWTLPAGVEQAGTGNTGTVTTTLSSIDIVAVAAGNLGYITVQASSSSINPSNIISTTYELVGVNVPNFSVATSDLTSCISNDGEIILSGLSPISMYEVSYMQETALQEPGMFTSNGTGEISITGLPSGQYSDIQVSQGSCIFTDNNTYTIETPVSISVSDVAFNSPVNCGEFGEIAITLSIDVDGELFGIDFDNDGLNETSGIASGTDITLTGIDSNLTVTNLQLTNLATSCDVSGGQNGSIVIPQPALVSGIHVIQPPSCDQDGSVEIHLSVANNGENYEIDIDNDGIADYTETVAGAALQIAAPGGTVINNIGLTNTGNNCQAVFDTAIVINDPSTESITGVSFTDPAQCGSTGTIAIAISGTVGSDNYAVDYNNDMTTDFTALVVNDSLTQAGIAAGTTVSNIRVTNENTQCVISFSASHVFTEPAKPVVTMSSYPQMCDYDSAITLYGGLPSGGNYYINGNEQTIFDPATQGPGTNEIVYQYTDANNCQNSDTVMLILNASPAGELICSEDDLRICEGDNISFTATGADNYEFFRNGVSEYSGSDEYFPNDIADQDTLSVTASSNDCYSDYQEVIITIDELPEGTLTSSTNGICAGEAVIFTASGGESYNYFINGVQASHDGSPEYSSTNLQNNDEVTVEVVSSEGCSAMAYTALTMQVTELSEPGITGDMIVCPNHTGSYYADSSANYTYNWSVEQGVIISGKGSEHIEVQWNDAGNSIVSLYVTDKLSGCTTSAETEVSVEDIEPPTIICPSDTSLTAEMDPVKGYFVTIDAQSPFVPFAEDMCSDALNLTADVNGYGGYQLNETGFDITGNVNEITWTVFDENSNSSSCSHVVSIEAKEEPPSAFTPNGDGINDYWKIKYLQVYPDAIVTVYDRNGRKVFESKNGYNDPWDGSSNGIYMPTDSYHYLIIKHKNAKPKKGTVTIIR